MLFKAYYKIKKTFKKLKNFTLVITFLVIVIDYAKNLNFVDDGQNKY